MKTSQQIVALSLSGIAAIVTPGCGDSTGPAKPTGTIEITVSTSSANEVDIDPDGYTLKVDDLADHNVAIEATLMIPGFAIGKHLVRLGGLAPNCEVNGDNPRSAEVITPELVSLTSFAVECHPPTDTDPDPWSY